MHYGDGQEVKLGDKVIGKPYNTPHEVVGTVVGLVPEAESCNLRVAFVVTEADDGRVPRGPRMGLDVGNGHAHAVWLGASSKSEPTTHLWPCVDYGDTKGFRLLLRAETIETDRIRRQTTWSGPEILAAGIDKAELRAAGFKPDPGSDVWSRA